MRYGYWLPVFGGWLRNVPDERMAATWQYVQRLARRSEEIGYDLTLIAELFLNDIKGIDAPALDAWSTAAALASVTSRLELMVAVRPTFHQPATLAKQAANIDQISNGRLSLNVVSSWWKDEARRYGIAFDEHDDRYARTAEWLAVIDAAWREPQTTFRGTYYQVEDLVVEPKPVASRTRQRPVIYAGGESPKAKEMTTRTPTAACAPDWLGRPSGWRIRCGRSRRLASICCCSSAVLSWRRWNGSPNRSCRWWRRAFRALPEGAEWNNCARLTQDSRQRFRRSRSRPSP
ncbi:MAG TPA: LLM class flavin-dependent oxidoreductase [Gemmatimonadaceae bacterium]|nr:LLM class flavin-dependent oxidoreductase [Gemmatimonadaceae bacterium]